jgi:hypothetical protein
MATYINENLGDGETLPTYTNQPRLLSAVVDFTDTESFPTGLAAADVVRVIAIPQNSIITSAGFEILSAASNNATLTLADTLSSPNVFVNASLVNVTGQAARTSVTNNLTTYPDGTQRYLTLTGAAATLTTGKVRVWALATSLNTRNTTGAKFST